MHDQAFLPAIDFLPVKYRDRKVKRNTHAWRGVVIGLFATIMIAATGYQWAIRFRAKRELEELLPRQQAAAEQTKHLVELQAKLQREAALADLYAYLQHPWPRTQILAAALGPLPEGIHLQELRIGREAGPIRPGGDRPRGKDDPNDPAKMSPALRDQRKLRDEYDHQLTVVTISGVTEDISSVHLYLRLLEKQDLFLKVDPGAIERPDSRKDGFSHFTVRLIVRPGYGQPGGPTTAPVENLSPLAQGGRP